MRPKLPFSQAQAESTGPVDLFSCYVMGEVWRYGTITEEQMRVIAEGVNEDAAALTSTDTNTIYFTRGSVTHTIAIHELMHVYFAETLTHSAKLTADQVEEVMCDVAAYNWFRIVLLARIMVHNLMCYERYVAGEKDQDWEAAPVDVIDGHVAEDICDLIATYISSCGTNPLLKASTRKKRRPRKGSPKKR